MRRKISSISDTLDLKLNNNLRYVKLLGEKVDSYSNINSSEIRLYRVKVEFGCWSSEVKKGDFFDLKISNFIIKRRTPSKIRGQNVSETLRQNYKNIKEVLYVHPEEPNYYWVFVRE